MNLPIYQRLGCLDRILLLGVKAAQVVNDEEIASLQVFEKAPKSWPVGP
ncbi:MAG: hypothetical protein ABIP48_02290 [Planctomycetota bacterium]